MRSTHSFPSPFSLARDRLRETRPHPASPASGRGVGLHFCSRLLAGLGLAALFVGGCADPVRQEQIAQLGEEASGVLPGPLHRPGQPCLLCHESAGLGPRFTVAGTVFRTPSLQQPVGGIKVQLIDAARHWFVAYTNCAGNFFVMPQQFEPVLPMWVSLAGQELHIDMDSAMNKDGDCGTCHQGKKRPDSAGYVFLAEDALMLDAEPKSPCTGSLP